MYDIYYQEVTPLLVSLSAPILLQYMSLTSDLVQTLKFLMLPELYQHPFLTKFNFTNTFTQGGGVQVIIENKRLIVNLQILDFYRIYFRKH